MNRDWIFRLPPGPTLSGLLVLGFLVGFFIAGDNKQSAQNTQMEWEATKDQHVINQQDLLALLTRNKRWGMASFTDSESSSADPERPDTQMQLVAVVTGKQRYAVLRLLSNVLDASLHIEPDENRLIKVRVDDYLLDEVQVISIKDDSIVLKLIDSQQVLSLYPAHDM